MKTVQDVLALSPVKFTHRLTPRQGGKFVLPGLMGLYCSKNVHVDAQLKLILVNLLQMANSCQAFEFVLTKDFNPNP